VELAKELLRDEQDTNGLSEDLIANLSDTDALALAGMVEDKPENTYEIETPSEASEELARHWTAWTEQQKREHIQRTGMTLEEVRAVADRRSKHSFS